MEKRLLSVNELGEYLGVSVNTIYSWVSQKLIPFIKCGRLTKFDKKVIDGLIDDGGIASVICVPTKKAVAFK